MSSGCFYPRVLYLNGVAEKKNSPAPVALQTHTSHRPLTRGCRVLPDPRWHTWEHPEGSRFEGCVLPASKETRRPTELGVLHPPSQPCVVISNGEAERFRPAGTRGGLAGRAELGSAVLPERARGNPCRGAPVPGGSEAPRQRRLRDSSPLGRSLASSPRRWQMLWG